MNELGGNPGRHPFIDDPQRRRRCWWIPGHWTPSNIFACPPEVNQGVSGASTLMSIASIFDTGRRIPEAARIRQVRKRPYILNNIKPNTKSSTTSTIMDEAIKACAASAIATSRTGSCLTHVSMSVGAQPS